MEGQQWTATMDPTAEFGDELESETTTVKFEWTLRGIKNLFESTKGDAKSKPTRSGRFGDGKWQVLFYANSGDGNVSLFLCCEPTQQEKDNALDGKWEREGNFRFKIEVKNLGKTILYHQKEAQGHKFSHSASTWGWSQYVRREAIYYNSAIAKQQDAYVFLCTIDSSPTSPTRASYRPTPKAVVEAVGSLLDDQICSDVEFVFPGHHRNGKLCTRKIYAARRLLLRSSHFEDMFNSGFSEASSDAIVVGGLIQEDPEANASESTCYFDDSDAEDDDLLYEGPGVSHTPWTDEPSSSPDNSTDNPANISGLEPFLGSTSNFSSDTSQVARNVRPKLMHPSSPRSNHLIYQNTRLEASPTISGPQKLRVIIKDVAYTTYRAVLYYLYTDTIVFAPLASSFHDVSKSREPSPEPSVGPRSRREWMVEWAKGHPGRPYPCSAKAAYRLADEYGLEDLKQRAFQHIINSLTADNICYEVFSRFSVTFDEIKKFQLKFFFDHFDEISSSDAFQNVGSPLRTNQHPGFEEVWPLIARRLQVVPLRVSSTPCED